MSNPSSTGESGEAIARLGEYARTGSDEDLHAWARTGDDGIRTLRDVLEGSLEPDWGDLHPRDQMDALSAAAAAIARAHPTEFLEVFRGAQFANSSFVLKGLGYIDNPEATARLASAARANDPFVRMDAAIGLGNRRSDVAEGVLIELIGDPEYLVRYHALRGLASTGRERALGPLRAFAGQTAVERDLAATAVTAIENRGQAQSPSD